ncbi:uncharacterized protein CDV56_104223 [Aspergillus thermomutatus]|uniref:Uncharacterized protein n=1 Tax=Aspergillus thermomutatus TaxID=41047 RepID=A0A397GDH6_ASPTH|nr:uncharacterized protein CDV56_104223 [Aspergillus thermomutatus]RHZ47446.1 hypothetical protein CDV56_104223 [Aspergillus thermomutatus]
MSVRPVVRQNGLDIMLFPNSETDDDADDEHFYSDDDHTDEEYVVSSDSDDDSLPEPDAEDRALAVVPRYRR